MSAPTIAGAAGRVLSVRRLAALVVFTLVASLLGAVVAPPEAEAGVWFNDEEYTYKEYWADHDSFSGTCHDPESPSPFTEPEPCAKSITMEIPDDIQSATAAVIYIDLWRNWSHKSARYTINSGIQRRTKVGSEWSRTPDQETIPLHEFVQGTNIITFQAFAGQFHVHDVMVRVYHDHDHPIIPGPGSDVTPPTGSLTGVLASGETFSPAAGGVLNVDDDQVKLTANANGASYVEFHGFYDGFDEDNDGITRDWHNFVRNNWNPGGMEPKPTGGTIGHIGTDATAPYDATWNLATVKNQTGVKFKIRAVDTAGNVREAAGGISAEFELARSHDVQVYTIPNFVDAVLYHGGEEPTDAIRTMDLPLDYNPANVERAYILGNYWLNPNLAINDATPFKLFQGTEDVWRTSVRQIEPALLRGGANKLQWTYEPTAFGQFVEKPGPMVVLHTNPPAGAPAITTQPQNALLVEGRRDGSGNAAFVMSVQGSKASGRYEVALERSNGVWRLMKGVVHTDSGNTIDVADRYKSIGDDSNTNSNSNSESGNTENLTSGKTISGGVLNGKAINLPKPPYPAIAKSAKASGSVVVQVLVDEEGNVVSARAISGHPLLRAGAAAAARTAKFSPTKLSGKPVRVSGVITTTSSPNESSPRMRINFSA